MYLDQIKQRCAQLGILGPDQVRPCTEAEVLELERHIGMALPGAYREFLLWTGRGSNLLMLGSHWSYSTLIDLQVWATELLTENQFPHRLPKHFFVFYMHQGYIFDFFRCDEGDDPPIFVYNEGRHPVWFEKGWDSFTEFLDFYVGLAYQDMNLMQARRWVQ